MLIAFLLAVCSVYGYAMFLAFTHNAPWYAIMIMSFFGLMCIAILVIHSIDKIFKTKFGCTILGHHDGKGKAEIDFDGCSRHAMCSKCGLEVMQDSQGNWFRAG
jgi:hypothetical protein